MNATLQTFSLLIPAQIMVAMVPGPNTALVLQTAVRDRTTSFVIGLGMWQAGMILSFLGLCGLGSLLLAMPQIGFGLRIACGGYLAWIGFKIIRSSLAARATSATGPVLTRKQAWRQGFLCNITNPKAIAYSASIYAATGAYDLPFWAQALAVVLLPGITMAWNCILTILASSPMARKKIAASARWIDRCAGLVMLAFGLKLLAQQ